MREVMITYVVVLSLAAACGALSPNVFFLATTFNRIISLSPATGDNVVVYNLTQAPLHIMVDVEYVYFTQYDNTNRAAYINRIARSNYKNVDLNWMSIPGASSFTKFGSDAQGRRMFFMLLDASGSYDVRSIDLVKKNIKVLSTKPVPYTSGAKITYYKGPGAVDGALFWKNTDSRDPCYQSLNLMNLTTGSVGPFVCDAKSLLDVRTAINGQLLYSSAQASAPYNVIDIAAQKVVGTLALKPSIGMELAADEVNQMLYYTDSPGCKIYGANWSTKESKLLYTPVTCVSHLAVAA